MSFTSNKTDFFYNQLINGLFDNTQDIDLMNYNYSPIKMMDVVTGVDKKTTQEVTIGFKKYNKIFIESHNNLYNMTFDPNIKNVFIVYLKRFDKDNYIAPVAMKVNETFLLKNNHVLNLGYMLQELDNKREVFNLLSYFKKSIFI